MSPRIVVIGSSNVDLIMKMAHLPQRGETVTDAVFCGSLAVALVEGRALDEGVRFASAAAALAVTRLGAQPSIPHRDEIERFLQDRIEISANRPTTV